jgi:hypothetical protein
MLKRLAELSFIGAGLWLFTASNVLAQTASPYNSPSGPGRAYFNERGVPNLTVSPYVNLGVNPNGLSNYQTLVRPMIDQREYSRAQTEQLQPPRPATRVARNMRDPIDDSAENGKSKPSVRFMHFSHFYGGFR